MSFFPEGFDPGGTLKGGLDLCAIETPDRPARFIIGTDGVFVDVNGDQWFGTQLASVSSLGARWTGKHRKDLSPCRSSRIPMQTI